MESSTIWLVFGATNLLGVAWYTCVALALGRAAMPGKIRIGWLSAIHAGLVAGIPFLALLAAIASNQESAVEYPHLMFFSGALCIPVSAAISIAAFIFATLYGKVDRSQSVGTAATCSPPAPRRVAIATAYALEFTILFILLRP